MELTLEFRLLVAALATWRLAHLLSLEDGPFGLVLWLRQRAGSGLLGQAMDCFYCISLWLAAPLALYGVPGGTSGLMAAPLHWLLAWWAVAGAAGLLHKATHREGAPP